MIDASEIREIASETGLNPYVVEKDYVIGWVLAGIYMHPEICEGWVFKGGTCLKKCFFETYRFSEDLDFTLCDAEHLDGRRCSRLIEPYSLRQSAEGHILLYAARDDSGKPRAYRVDHIRGATVVNRMFVPRYTIELTRCKFALSSVSGLWGTVHIVACRLEVDYMP